MYVNVRVAAALMLLACSFVSGQWLETTIVLPDASRPYALCYNSADDKVYSANYNTDSVTIINGATNAIITTLAVNDQPYAFCYNSANDKVYCLNTGTAQNISVIDGATNAIVATIPAGPYAQQLCYNPQNNKVYCSNMYGNNVTVIDGGSNTVVDTVPTGSGPNWLYYYPPANEVYVTNVVGMSVTVIDGATNEVTATISGTAPNMLCGNPHDNKVYGANTNPSNVVITDGSSHAILDTVVGIMQPTAVVYNEHNNKVYVNSRTGTPSSIKTIDGTTNQVVDSISVAGPGTALCYNRYTNKLFTEDAGHCWLSVIDCGTNTLLKTVGVDTSPYLCMVWNPPNNRVYVGCWMMVPWASSGISVIRDSGGGVEEMVNSEVRRAKGGATVVRGVLVLPVKSEGRAANGELLDATGRKVLALRPGANDVSALSSGVYFVRTAGNRKVLVER
jgi:YVTN family beta-propeller protein